ncbi:uncharacterized protein LOC141894570 [Acropora palmata]|uniref:uncharacterized protein LOC141894570 n=1 Tax=Acropora palmata TaxID=6131 RepID=UPI003DA07300
MAEVNELYLFQDDFGTILEILEDEEELDEQFREAAIEVQLENTVCELCLKKCKSKSGLKRHITVKHKDTSNEGEQHRDLGFVAYSRIVEKAKLKIVDNKIYPKEIRDEIESFTNLEDSSAEFSEIQSLHKRLKKSGNTERFYACFYSSIVLNAVKHFKGLTRNAATLLSTKVADCLLVYSKEKIENQTSTCSLLTKLSSEEKAGLQYIGGYVLHKLHNKHVNTKKSSESEQAISILKAGKARDQDSIQSQRLTSSLNRGGLWAITENAQSVFERTEHYFRDVTSDNNFQKIDVTSVISRSVHDVEVVSAYNSMLLDSELMINKGVAKDVLHTIIELYVKVRSFSFAKDIIQRHKMKLKQLKSKALRKEISRASKESEQQRQS